MPRISINLQTGVLFLNILVKQGIRTLSTIPRHMKMLLPTGSCTIFIPMNTVGEGLKIQMAQLLTSSDRETFNDRRQNHPTNSAGGLTCTSFLPRTSNSFQPDATSSLDGRPKDLHDAGRRHEAHLSQPSRSSLALRTPPQLPEPQGSSGISRQVSFNLRVLIGHSISWLFRFLSLCS